MQRLSEDAIPEGPPLALTVGIGMRTAAFSPDETKLAYLKGRWVANVWRVPILTDRVATWDDAQQLTFDEAYVEYFAGRRRERAWRPRCGGVRARHTPATS